MAGTIAAVQALQNSYGSAAAGPAAGAASTSAASANGTAADGTIANGTVADGTAMFKDVLSNVVSSANSADSVFQADVLKAAAGELDNPQQLLIDASKADVSLQLAIGVRDKALEAYNSILNMQV